MFRQLAIILFTCISLTVFGQSSDVLLAKAFQWFDKGDYLQAASYYARYIKTNRDDVLSYVDLGSCLYQLGDVDGACQAYRYADASGLVKKQGVFELLCFRDKKFESLKKQFSITGDLLPENNYRPFYSRADSLRGANTVERACYDVLHYNLKVRIHPVKHFIEGSNVIRLQILHPTEKIQLDLSENLSIDSIVGQHSQLSYVRECNAVFVQFQEMLDKGDELEISVYYRGKPRKSGNPPWDDGFVWASNGLADVWASVVCQQYGGLLWWPTKDYLGDKPDSMLLTFEVPSRYELVSNGTFLSSRELDKNFTAHTWRVNYPINPYNVTFYMGNYVKLSDTIERPQGALECTYYVRPNNERKALAHFTSQVPDMMAVYEMRFGPYPFPKDGFRLVESPYEGMEHQTAIAYGSGFNNQSKSFVYTIQEHDFVILHEAAHEWWGNALAVSDLADAWIHEGFATYAEFLFLEAIYGSQLAIEEFRPKIRYINNFWPLVQNRNVNEDSFLGSDIYYKGAFMIHSLRSTINDDSLFFTIIHDFNVLYRFKPVSSADFIHFVNKYTHADYRPFFQKYLYDERLPVLKYSFKPDGEGVMVRFRWTEVDDGFFMPFSVGYGEHKSMRIDATTEQQTIYLPNTSSFWFYNEHSTLEGLPHNGFTYYWTSGEFLREIAAEEEHSSGDFDPN